MTPISFPYRDMGMIWESHLLHNAKKQEFIQNYFASVFNAQFFGLETNETAVVC